MCAAFFRGTQLEQNVKFQDQEKKLIKSRKWPEIFETVVDLKKVQIDVIKIWIERRITELLGCEDDIVYNFAISLLEDAAEDMTGKTATKLCPKKLQISLTGFLEEQTSVFVEELWNLLISAQNEESGIPKQLIKEKQDEKERKIIEIQAAKEKLEKIRNFAVAATREMKQSLQKTPQEEADETLKKAFKEKSQQNKEEEKRPEKRRLRSESSQDSRRSDDSYKRSKKVTSHRDERHRDHHRSSHHRSERHGSRHERRDDRRERDSHRRHRQRSRSRSESPRRRHHRDDRPRDRHDDRERSRKH